MALKMSSKLMYGTGVTDLREGINVPRMREERAARMKKIMKQEGIPVVLVTDQGNLRYLLGYTYSEFQPYNSYALFFADQEHILFAHAGSYQQMPDQMPWIKEWRIARCSLSGIGGPEVAREEVKLFCQEIREELKTRGLAREKLGIIDFDAQTREGLKEAGLKVVEAWPLILEASKIKTQDEINCFKLALSICSSGFKRILDVCKIGMSSGTLTRLVYEALLDAGAESARPIVFTGPLTSERPVVPPLDRRIEYGDILYAPLCLTRYMGYPSCIYRTYIVGREPNAQEKGWYQRIKDTLDAAMEASKPGNTTADAAKFFPPASKWGYKSELEVLTVEIGHGLGLPRLGQAAAPYGYPVINRQWSLQHPQPFEKGMVIAYESLEGIHRVGGARLEDMVLVTEDGSEMLDWFPRDEILVIPV